MILCCGEALIDMIPVTAETGPDTYAPRPGGAVLNTAVALGRLGAPAAMLTGLSTDMFGRRLAAHLAGSHVDTKQVIWSDRATTLAFVELVSGEASYCFYDENSAGRMLTLAEVPPLPPEFSTLFFGGISLTSAPACECYADLLAREGDSRVVMIDPNIRPGLIKDASGYRRRLNRMLAQADIVKLSQEDLAWLFPNSTDEEAKIQTLLDQGPALVALTRGAKGATGYLTDGAVVKVSALPCRVVDTVGAGDAFNAGLLAKLSELDILSKAQVRSLAPACLQLALEHGTRAAARTVTRIGADPPWAAEL
jgi:fructokinase